MLEYTKEETYEAENNTMPSGFSSYYIDGERVWCRSGFISTIDKHVSGIHDFIQSLTCAENKGDIQDLVNRFCEDNKFDKPCFGEYCSGCNNPNEFCGGE